MRHLLALHRNEQITRSEVSGRLHRCWQNRLPELFRAKGISANALLEELRERHKGDEHNGPITILASKSEKSTPRKSCFTPAQNSTDKQFPF